MRKGTRHTEATRLKQSIAASGVNNPLYGHHRDLETIKKLRMAAKRLWRGATYRKRVAEGQRRVLFSKKYI